MHLIHSNHKNKFKIHRYHTFPIILLFVCTINSKTISNSFGCIYFLSSLFYKINSFVQSVHQSVCCWKKHLWGVLSCLSALIASGWQNPQRSSAVSSHESSYLIQTKPSHCFSIHLQNFIPNTEEADIRALSTAIAHFFNINTYKARKWISVNLREYVFWI